MKQNTLRRTIDNTIFDHCKTIKRMGWVRPGKEELAAYAFHHLDQLPVRIAVSRRVVQEVHHAVDSLIRGKFYKRMEIA